MREAVKIVLTLAMAFCMAGAALAQPRKLVIDQDSFGPGGSNLQAILMALQAPDVEVLGITVESGDGWVDENVSHLLRMLELIGRTDVKVYAGVTYPLINSPEASKRREAMYGKVAYKGAWNEEWDKYNSTGRSSYHGPHVIPPMREGTPSIKAQAERASDFLVREVRAFPNEITIMALGPETNIALAVRLDEDFASLAKEIVLEGASFNPRPVPGDPFAVQFVNTPRNSTNFWWDPEAAHIVLHAPWKRITVVPIDATTNTKLTEAIIEKATHTAGTAQTPIQKYVDDYANRNFPMWDEAAFAIWLKPGLIVEHEALQVDVDTNPGGSNYGGTLSWAPDKGPGLGEASVEAVDRVDVPALDELFVKLVSAVPGRGEASSILK